MREIVTAVEMKELDIIRFRKPGYRLRYLWRGRH